MISESGTKLISALPNSEQLAIAHPPSNTNHRKGRSTLFFLTGFYSNNKLEMNGIQNEEYKTAVLIAEQFIPEIKLKRDDYKMKLFKNVHKR